MLRNVINPGNAIGWNIRTLFHHFISFNYFVIQASSRILRTEEHLLNAALDCIFACERDDQLSFVLSILECLPHRKHGYVESLMKKSFCDKPSVK